MRLLLVTIVAALAGHATPLGAQPRNFNNRFLRMNDSSIIRFRSFDVNYGDQTVRITGNSRYKRIPIPLSAVAYINNRGTLLKKMRATEAVFDTLTQRQRAMLYPGVAAADNRMFARLILDGPIALYDHTHDHYELMNTLKPQKKLRGNFFWLDPADGLLKPFHLDSLRLAFPDFYVAQSVKRKSARADRQVRLLVYTWLGSSGVALTGYLISGFGSRLIPVSLALHFGSLTGAVLLRFRQNGRHYALVEAYNRGRMYR